MKCKLLKQFNLWKITRLEKELENTSDGMLKANIELELKLKKKQKLNK